MHVGQQHLLHYFVASGGEQLRGTGAGGVDTLPAGALIRKGNYSGPQGRVCRRQVYGDRHAWREHASLLHSGEHALTRHDAVAYAVEDLAVAVALLADLRELEDDSARCKRAADWQLAQVDAAD